MGAMRYKPSDRVRIKSLDWYNENKNKFGKVWTSGGQIPFDKCMSEWCGKVMTISHVRVDHYTMVEDLVGYWTDEMIKGLVEEETKSEPKFHISDWATGGDVLADDSCIFIIQKLGDNGTAAKTYCALHNDGYFEDGSILYFDIDSTKPATEEEKQKLFKAIKDNGYKWNPETKTLEKLIEPKFKVGDKIKLKSTLLNDIFGVIGYEPEGYRITNISNGLTYFMSYSIEHCYELVEEEGKETSWKPSKEEMDVLYSLAYITNKYDEHKEEVITRLYQDLKREFFNDSSYENMFPNTENDVRRRSTIQVLEYARSLDNYNQYGKTDIDKNIAWLEKQGKSALEARTDNELVEKANTLKAQSDNTETETHRGYCTTEGETTNESKKVAWFTFWDNDFADKVELDLSDRELIQEDGKWFVVKKKKEYPKTYEECCKVLDWNHRDYDRVGYESELLCKLQVLLLCRDAYWKIAGEEMGLGKPWEPDWKNDEQFKYIIICRRGCIIKDTYTAKDVILAFPTEEMRDAFYENFKELIEQCKELL